MARTYEYRTRKVSPKTRRDVFARDNYTCRRCGFRPIVPEAYDGRLTLSGTRVSDGRVVYLELDHIVAWSAGGAAVPGNLQTLCNSCNARKGSGS